MQLKFEDSIADGYTSPSQRIRRLSEHWVSLHCYCPVCGQDTIKPYVNNRPAADFYCDSCDEDFELKSKSGRFGPRVADGALATMLQRVRDMRNPNLLLLSYDRHKHTVLDLIAVPKHFFISSMIIPRPPLGPHARRAGWTGCNICLRDIPTAGKIYLVRDGFAQPRPATLTKWQATRFLRQTPGEEARGWLLSVMRCIETIGQPTFTINEMYSFEDRLRMDYPANRHIREKIRQQLQKLRDRGYLEFLGKGIYRSNHSG
jgi:type II restriction enzyme